MAKLRKAKLPDGGFQYMFTCPGCDEWHGCKVPGWTFNGDMDKPTFSPSLKVTMKRHEQPTRICHSFIKDGMIQFLNDCHHKLAGQTVEIPEMDE